MDSVSMVSSEMSFLGPRPKRCFSFNMQEAELLKNQVSNIDCDNYQRMNQIMRSIDCSACREPFVYELRSHPDCFFCSPTCLLAASKKFAMDELVPPTPEVGLSELATPQGAVRMHPQGTSNTNVVEITLDDYVRLRHAPTQETPFVTLTGRDLANFLASGKGTESHSKKTYEPKPIDVARHANLDLRPPLPISPAPATCTDAADAEVPVDPKADPDMECLKIVDKENRRVDANASPSTKIWTIQDLCLSPAFIEGAQVVLAAAVGHQLVLVAVTDFGSIADVQKSLKPYCLKAPVLKNAPSVDDILFVQNPANEVWYRARVKKIHVDECDKTTVTVKCLDHGYQLYLPLYLCRRPCSDIMEKHPLTYTMRFALDYESKSMPNYRTELLPFSPDEVFSLHFTQNLPSVYPKLGDLFFQNGSSAMEVLQEFLVGPPQKACATDKEKESTKSQKQGSKDGGNNVTNQELNGCHGNKKGDKKDSLEKRNQNGGYKSNGRQETGKSNGKKQEAEGQGRDQVQSKKTQPATEVPAERNAQTMPKPEENTKKSQSQTSESKEQTRKKEKTNFSGMALSTSLREGAKVQVNFFWTLGRVTLAAIEDNGKLNELQDQIDNYVATAPRITSKPAIDDIIIAPYQDAHYRARVLGYKKPRHLVVDFIDFGDQETVCATDCYTISPELFQVPMFGIEAFVDQVPENARATGAATDDLGASSWDLEVIGKPKYATWKVQLTREDGLSYSEIAVPYAEEPDRRSG